MRIKLNCNYTIKYNQLRINFCSEVVSFLITCYDHRISASPSFSTHFSLFYSTEKRRRPTFRPPFWPRTSRHVFAGAFTMRRRRKEIFLSLSLPLLSLLTPRHERAWRRYLHFYARVCFSSGNRNSASGVDSQRRRVLRSIGAAFHLQPAAAVFLQPEPQVLPLPLSPLHFPPYLPTSLPPCPLSFIYRYMIRRTLFLLICLTSFGNEACRLKENEGFFLHTAKLEHPWCGVIHRFCRCRSAAAVFHECPPPTPRCCHRKSQPQLIWRDAHLRGFSTSRRWNWGAEILFFPLFFLHCKIGCGNGKSFFFVLLRIEICRF